MTGRSHAAVAYLVAAIFGTPLFVVLVVVACQEWR